LGEYIFSWDDIRMNIRTLLEQFAQRDIPRSEVRLLVSHVLQRDHAWLVTHDTDELSATHIDSIRVLIARRVAGEPIAYILGYREFYGRRFKCSAAALIPRSETELLVDTVLTLTSVRGDPVSSTGVNAALTLTSVRGDPVSSTGVNAALTLTSVRGDPVSSTGVNAALTLTSVRGELVEPRILDIGTGTGCIAITLALELQNASVTACDLSRDALALARENARALNADITFIESDWFSAFNERDQFDIIVSNPPYIVPNDPHLFQGDLRFEPWLALQDRGDGLQSYRELAAGAKKHLRDGGVLIVEHGFDQGESVPALFRDAGFADVEMMRDLAGQPRITRCKKSPRA
jgi:release factor glutamine methyltransferase